MELQDLIEDHDITFRVAEGRSVAYRDELGELQRISAGKSVPDDMPNFEEQVLQWLAGGYVVRADDPDEYDSDERHRPSGPGSVELQRGAKGLMQERIKRDKRAKLAAARQARLAKAGVPASEAKPEPKRRAKGKRIEQPGIWNFDPAGFEGVSLENLQVRIAEVMAAHGLDIGMPQNVADCIKLLSSQYVPGTQPE